MSKKLSRSLLKEIVKECLVELLFEGLDSDELLESVQPRKSRNQPMLSAAVEARTKKSKPQRKNARPKLSRQAESIIPTITDDPMMAEIFADTARTTLVEQAGHEGRGAPATAEAAVVADVQDMEDIFEGAGNWASIAFAGQKDS